MDQADDDTRHEPQSRVVEANSGPRRTASYLRKQRNSCRSNRFSSLRADRLIWRPLAA